MMSRRDVFKVFGGAAGLPAVESVKRLEAGPEDTIVVKLNGRASQENLCRVKKVLEMNHPDRKFLVHDETIDVSVIKEKVRPCAHVGCPELVKRGRCKKHELSNYKQDRDRRGTSSERGYDGRWAQYRRRFLQHHPLCKMCLDEDRVAPAVMVDHIVPVQSADDPLFWDTRNHQGLCNPCNGKKTAADIKKGLTR